MSALKRWREAMNAGHAPSKTTHAAALAELDGLVDNHMSEIREVLELRGSLEGLYAQKIAIDRLGELIHSAHTAPAPAEPLPSGENCADCDRPARVWSGEVGYCKRHAFARGVNFKGKV